MGRYQVLGYEDEAPASPQAEPSSGGGSRFKVLGYEDEAPQSSFLDPQFDLGQSSFGMPAYQKPEASFLDDLPEIGGGLARGTADLGGLLTFGQQFIPTGPGGFIQRAADSARNYFMKEKPTFEAPGQTADALRDALNPILPGDAETPAGRVAQTAAEYLPSAVLPLGNAGIVGRTVSTLGSGIAAGAAKEAGANELGQLGAAIVGGGIPALLTPTAGENAASKFLKSTAQDFDRKSVGARASDYAKTANQLQSIELPDGDIESFTKSALDDLLERGKLGPSRDPSKMIPAARKESQQLSEHIGGLIDEYDKTVGKSVIPKFSRAKKYIADGKVPADKIASYRRRLETLGQQIQKEGKGKLAYLQQQKIAQGRIFDPADSTLNGFNRQIYYDMQKEIEKRVPKIADLNNELSKYKVTEKILERALGAAENETPLGNLTSMMRTSGGYGVAFGAGTLAGGLPLGLATAGALGYARTPSGMQNIAKGLTAASRGTVNAEGVPTRALLGALSGLGEKDKATTPQTGIDPLASQIIPTAGAGLSRSSTRPQITAVGTQPRSVPQTTPSNIAALISEQPPLIQAIIKAESNGNPGAVSKKGAQGLMQLMPEIQKAFNISDPFDPAESIRGGTALLQEELERFGDPVLAIAAYNAGSPKVLKAIKRAGSRNYEDISAYLPRETRAYVDKVLSYA